jgi:surfeit locus 1 family protein
MSAPARAPSFLRRIPLAPTCACFLAFLFLCGLGTWQLERLHWKRGVLAELDRLYAQDAAANPLTAASFKPPRAGAFVRGTASGRLDYAQDFLVGPRTRDGVPGYHLITPLHMAYGLTLLVNRGWLPDQSADGATAETILAADSARPAEEMDVAGVARPAPRPPFALRNAPDRGRWYWVEIPVAAAYFKLSQPAPYVLRAEDRLGRDADAFAYPLPLPRAPYPPNNHLQYAFTWFALAGALLVIYYLRFIRPLLGPAPPAP